jgi:hypothetical protein
MSICLGADPVHMAPCVVPPNMWYSSIIQLPRLKTKRRTAVVQHGSNKRAKTGKRVREDGKGVEGAKVSSEQADVSRQGKKLFPFEDRHAEMELDSGSEISVEHLINELESKIDDCVQSVSWGMCFVPSMDSDTENHEPWLSRGRDRGTKGEGGGM